MSKLQKILAGIITVCVVFFGFVVVRIVAAPNDTSVKLAKIPQEKQLGKEAYKIIYVGSQVQKNLRDLGHITLRFNANEEGENLEGSLYLENKEVGDIEPGEAIFVDLNHQLHARQCAQQPMYAPCIFEYVYLARPDTVIDGVSVYEARLAMGELLAEKVKQIIPVDEIDVVIPIPDSSRPSAMQLAQRLGIPYREGFVKNRYIGRTFIMPGQSTRKKSVRQKLNTVAQEFKGKRVLLVDDSIVRGTTSREIVDMARAAGALKVYFASAAPPVRYPNVYGIDMPTRGELIATGRSDEEIAREIGADALVYQDLDALKASVSHLKPELSSFDCSCFDGKYVTGDVTPDYLDALERAREKKLAGAKDEGGDSRQLNSNNQSAS